jgi:hypothetical protein
MIPKWALFLTSDEPICPLFSDHDCDATRSLWWKLFKMDNKEWKKTLDAGITDFAMQRMISYKGSPNWPTGSGKKWKTLPKDAQLQRFLVYASQKSAVYGKNTLALYTLLEERRKDLDVVIQDGWISKIRNLRFNDGMWLLTDDEKIAPPKQVLLVDPLHGLPNASSITSSARLAGFVILVILQKRSVVPHVLKKIVAQAIPSATSVQIDDAINLIMSVNF